MGSSGNWPTWSFPPSLVLAMAAVLAAYALLAARRGVPAPGMLAFLGGLAALALALFSPLDPLGECCRLSLHMLQHQLIWVTPILLLWGLRGALPAPAPAAARWVVRLTRPAPALGLMLLNLYLWHVPAAYQGAVLSRSLHGAQHLLYLLTALLYWWNVVDPLPGQPALSPTGKLGYLLAGAGGMMPLGVILLWAPAPVYPHYVRAAVLQGFSALVDQQWAALTMLAWGGLVLAGSLAAGFLLLTRAPVRPGTPTRG